MAGLLGLGHEVVRVVNVELHHHRRALLDANPMLSQATELARVVGGQANRPNAQHLQNQRRHAIITQVVVKAQVLISNCAYFDEVNAIYAKYFPHDPPARSFVTIGSWPWKFDIEIECVAVA